MSGMRSYSERSGIRMPLVNQQRARVEFARNEIVASAAKVPMPNGTYAKSDYILWIDSDMRFPHTTLVRLLKHQKDIVGCNAAKRNDTGELAIKKDRFGKNLTPQDFKKVGLKQVQYIGMAVTLVKFEVYEKVPRPWYYCRYSDSSYVGEDQNFCDEARAQGYHIWCDMDLSKEIGHMGARTWYIGKHETQFNEFSTIWDE